MTLADAIAVANDPYGIFEDDSNDDIEWLRERPVEDGRILVVDDDPKAVEFMCHLIERAGFPHVSTANDGRRALELLSEQPPDMVVLDVHLPEVDGFAVLREIVRNDKHSGHATGVLAVSGDASAATAQTMLWAGADDFIPRPFESADFTLRVRHLADRTRSLRRALAYSHFLERCPPDHSSG